MKTEERVGTEAGRRLLDRLRGNGEPWDGNIWRDIAVIEAETRRAALDEAIAVLDRSTLFDPADRITAMSGAVREPRTPADYVEAYRTRLYTALTALRDATQQETDG